MNLLFFTQSRSLDVFYQVLERLRRQVDVGRVGFYVANLLHYEEFLAEHPDFESHFPVVKEWEICRRAEGCKPDLARIERYEREIGDPFLWSPLVTDRRLYLGKKSAYRQDYAPRFTHPQRLAILDLALQEIDALFQTIQPDVAATLYTATFGDCLGHQFAQARGMVSLDLRLARLKNYVMFADGVSEPPPHVARIHESFRGGIPAPLREEAEAYVASVVESHAMYDGVLPAREKQKPSASMFQRFGSPLHRLGQTAGAVRRYFQMQRPPYSYDLQQQDILIHSLYHHVLYPLHLRRLRFSLRRQMVRRDDLPALNYILYPLHVEPETVIAQFSRPFLNQIEVIRNISLAMPVGMTLLVKDHPMMVSRRTLGYYRKILEIPSVRLVDLDLASESVLRHARLVVILRGSIGLEAVLKRIPVVCLGQALFSLLPETMFRTCYNLYDLPRAVHAMLHEYQYDHEALVRYLAAVIHGSAPVNLITDLLGKSGRFRTDVDREIGDWIEHPHLDRLADYFLQRFEESRGLQPPAREKEESPC